MPAGKWPLAGAAVCAVGSPEDDHLSNRTNWRGFSRPVAYVKPGRSIHELGVKSVRKKLKDKAFARSVNRDDIANGAAELNVDLDQQIGVLHRRDERARAELGLAGAEPLSTVEHASPQS